MEEALDQLPLSPAAKQTLLGRPSAMRSILDSILAQEVGDWADVDLSAANAGVTPAAIYNPFEPGFAEDPYPQFAELSVGNPVQQTPLGLWALFGYDDAVRLLRDPSLSVEDRSVVGRNPRAEVREQILGDRPQRGTHQILNLDPPDHTRLRRLVQQVFTPRTVEQLTPRVQAMVDDAPVRSCKVASDASTASRADPALRTEAANSLIKVPSATTDCSSSPERCRTARSTLCRAARQTDSGWSRIATIGERSDARQAGAAEAANVTAPTIAVAERKGTGPTFPIAKTRPRYSAAPSPTTPPTTTPMVAIFSPLPMISASTLRLVAPRAIRVPISTVRCRTE